MFELHDTFNDRLISRHRTIDAAARAELAHDRAVKRANGSNSYIPTAITEDGEPVGEYALDAARDRARYA